MSMEQRQNGTVGSDKDKEVAKIMELLNSGTDQIVLDKEKKNIALILGNTGDGKSTFIQWLFGDNSKLISKRVGKGNYIITDGNEKISDSTTKSKTIIPEQVTDGKTGAVYYDCPGFSDTRNPSYEIAAARFIKKVADHAEKVKLIFLISHHAVRIGLDRQHFTSLIRHATHLIKDIGKFKNSIAMVVTKVDNQVDLINGEYVLTSDKEVIDDIREFLKSIKKELEDMNAIKFINILLTNEVENYTKIGIFRRPDREGSLNNIELLQKGKLHIEDILNNNLNFTEKNDTDFGFTLSDTAKGYINVLTSEINQSVWSSLQDIVKKVKEHYDTLAGEVRDKISSFANSKGHYPSASQVDACIFLDSLKLRRNIMLQFVEQTKNLTSIEELSKVLNSTFTAFGIIGMNENEILNIKKREDDLKFLQIVYDRKLNTLPWATLLEVLRVDLPNSMKMIQNNIDSTEGEIKKNIEFSVGNIIREIEGYYQNKVNSLCLHKLPSELNKMHNVAHSIVQDIHHFSNAQQLANKIRDYVIKLDIDTSVMRRNTLNISNQGKYLTFLNIISNKNLNANPSKWTHPFNKIVKNIQNSEIFYKFLDELYIKLSEYKIQNNTEMYNVHDIQDWGSQSGSARKGINIDKVNFKHFLGKVGEYGAVSNIGVTEFQLKKLNQALSLTLKYNLDRGECSASTPTRLILKGDYVKFSDFVGSLQYRCKDKVDSIDIFALKTVFIDADLIGIGDKLKVTIISPKWEIIGTRKIVLDGYDAVAHKQTKNDGTDGTGRGYDGKAGLGGGSAGSFFGIGTEFINGKSLTITANGGKGGPGQDGADGANGQCGEDAENPNQYNRLGEYLENNNYAFLLDEAFDQYTQYGKMNMNTKHEKIYLVYGRNGRKGGNGGNGGLGGFGGMAGEIDIVNLGSYTALPFKERRVGNIGTAGFGGEGGVGGANGYSFKVYHRKFFNIFTFFYDSDGTVEVIENNIPTVGYSALKGDAGSDGISGKREHQSEPLIHDPIYILNDFKAYLRGDLC